MWSNCLSPDTIALVDMLLCFVTWVLIIAAVYAVVNAAQDR